MIYGPDNLQSSTQASATSSLQTLSNRKIFIGCFEKERQIIRSNVNEDMKKSNTHTEGGGKKSNQSQKNKKQSCHDGVKKINIRKYINIYEI